MAKITWDAVGERRFETGVGHGVVYPKDGPGVPWNGLVNVTEKIVQSSSESVYLDGIKLRNEIVYGEFEASVEAFTYPPELSNLTGLASNGRGLTYDNQEALEFDLSYQALSGNGTSEDEYTNIIHLVYNAKALPTDIGRSTISSTPEPANFSWEISTLPIRISSRKPTSHIIIDQSMTSDFNWRLVTDALYGTELTAPRMPTISEVITIFDDWSTLEIVPDSLQGLSELVYFGKPDLTGDVFSGLYKAPENTRLLETNEPGLFRLE